MITGNPFDIAFRFSRKLTGLEQTLQCKENEDANYFDVKFIFMQSLHFPLQLSPCDDLVRNLSQV